MHCDHFFSQIHKIFKNYQVSFFLRYFLSFFPFPFYSLCLSDLQFHISIWYFRVTFYQKSDHSVQSNTFENMESIIILYWAVIVMKIARIVKFRSKSFFLCANFQRDLWCILKISCFFSLICYFVLYDKEIMLLFRLPMGGLHKMIYPKFHKPEYYSVPLFVNT